VGSETVGVLDVIGGYNVLGNASGYINRVGITPQAGKRVILKYCDVQTDAVGTLLVYGKLAKYSGDNTVTRGDKTLVASMATANDTAEVDGNIYGGYWLEFGVDEHVVISAGWTRTSRLNATKSRNCGLIASS
jgi:hypothetical protein